MMAVASKALTRVRERPDFAPFAYLKHDEEKRLVEVRWVEDGVATVHDLLDRDETSTFEITKDEIHKWEQVYPAEND